LFECFLIDSSKRASGSGGRRDGCMAGRKFLPGGQAGGPGVSGGGGAAGIKG